MVALLIIGMAGSGKTSLMQRISAHLHAKKTPPYVVNLDPAVAHLPYGANIDIRDTIDYKKTCKTYQLGPNGGIVTALNLFTTKFDQVLSLIKKKDPEFVLFDTPGQIEIFTWSASGQIITESTASDHPTVILYVIDTPRSTAPVTFMSNMLYACSILYKLKLPFIILFNKIDVVSHEECLEWMQDFDAFSAALEQDTSYMATLCNSMSILLEEFYQHLKVVGVSAATGQGMDELFEKVKEAVEEYETDYKPELQRKMQEKLQKENDSKMENLKKLIKDMTVVDAHDIRLDADDEDTTSDQKTTSVQLDGLLEEASFGRYLNK